MPTLDLMDLSETPALRVDSVTLNEKGKLSYEGTLIKDLFDTYLPDWPAEKVFSNFTGWSNGYLRLQPRGGN